MFVNNMVIQKLPKIDLRCYYLPRSPYSRAPGTIKDKQNIYILLISKKTRHVTYTKTL
jgi:hypothetical protein